jgi:hypothetical protein
MDPSGEPSGAISLRDVKVAEEHYLVSATSVDINGEASAILGFQNVSDLKRYETELVEAKDKAGRA